MQLLSYWQEMVPLSEVTFYKMGGLTKYFTKPKNINQIYETLKFCRENKICTAILGLGSNCVFADGLFDGLVLSLENLANFYWESESYLYAEAGVTNTQIAEACLQACRDGAWWMFRMPGQVGASVRMNARCFGGEMEQVVCSVLAIDASGKLSSYDASEIFLGYKSTLFMNNPHLIIGVRFYFPNQNTYENILQKMHECESERLKKHHFDYPSCGSTFKNNYNLGKPSGQIFDELKFKGTTIGEAQVSNWHGNFIWNLGRAKTEDMLTLASSMREKVMHELGSQVDLEVQPVGVFSNKLFDKCGMEKLGPFFSYHGKEKQQEKWVGLFYHPNQDFNQKEYPCENLSATFSSYQGDKQKNFQHIKFKITQLLSMNDAQKFVNEPFLKWETQTLLHPKNIFHTVPHLPDGSFVNKLWEYSVSEIFMARADDHEKYIEVELNHLGHHIFLCFSGIRTQSSLEFSPIPKFFFHENSLPDKSYKYSFGLYFSYSDLEYVLKNSSHLAIQGALSLGNEDYSLAPHWGVDSSRHDNKPDFHQPGRYFLIKLH